MASRRNRRKTKRNEPERYDNGSTGDHHGNDGTRGDVRNGIRGRGRLRRGLECECDEGMREKDVAYMVDGGETHGHDIDLEAQRCLDELCDELRLTGDDEGLFRVHAYMAAVVWEALEDVCVDSEGCTDMDYMLPILGLYPRGTVIEEIWHDIEERFGISVAWLMGEAKNPDGTND